MLFFISKHNTLVVVHTYIFVFFIVDYRFFIKIGLWKGLESVSAAEE